MDFGDDVDEDFDVDEARRKQDEEFDFSAMMMKQTATDGGHKESSQGLSSDDTDYETCHCLLKCFNARLRLNFRLVL